MQQRLRSRTCSQADIADDLTMSHSKGLLSWLKDYWRTRRLAETLTCPRDERRRQCGSNTVQAICDHINAPKPR